MDQIEQCPHCGRITEGVPVYEIKRQVARTGVKWATKKVILTYIITPIVGSVIFPILGTIIGFIVAYFIVLYVDKKAEEVTDTLDMSVYSSVPFDFCCPRCGNTWKRTYEKGIDFTTDYVLKWQKERLVEGLRSDASSYRVTAVIAGIICAPCAFYCITHLSGQSEYLLWWLLFIIGLPALGISINYGVKSHDRNEEADELETMSVSSFRHSSYRAGNPFVGIDRPLDKEDEVKDNKPKELTQLKPEEVTPIEQNPSKQLDAVSTDAVKDNLVKLDELLTAGILTEEEYAEQKNKIAPSRVQSAIQTPVQRKKVNAKVENNKIAILNNLKLLLDSGVLTSEEYRKQKHSTLSVASIPWDNNMTPLEILVEMKNLLNADILTQEEFNFHKKAVLSNEHSRSWSKSIKGTLLMLNTLIKSDALTEEELTELKNKLAKAAIPIVKDLDYKTPMLENLKLLIDAEIITPEEYRKQKLSILSNKWIPWDKNKTKYEILEGMKSLLDADILTQEEFDFHKKIVLSDND